MATESHEISRAIGALEASVALLTKLFDRHCDDDEARHKENQAVAKETIKEITALRLALQPLAASIGVMRPIVDSFQLTRSKMAAWASIGLTAIALVGWAIEAIVKWAVATALSHWN